MLAEIEYSAVERRDSREASGHSPRQRSADSDNNERNDDGIVDCNGDRHERQHDGYTEAPEEQTGTSASAETELAQRGRTGVRESRDQRPFGAAFRRPLNAQDPMETSTQGSSHWLRYLRC